MLKRWGHALFSLLLMTAQLDAENASDIAPVTQLLLKRVVPAHASQFQVEMITDNNGQDIFEIESVGDKVVLRGNTPLSAAVALNWYLKYYCHCSVSINGNNLNLPDRLPLLREKVRMMSWARARYLFNYCAFGYSMPWWDWQQWERFIDWMALNGVNMPLAVTGQEAVWQAVGKQFGMTDAEIKAFLAGPPYLPFQWMGCLDSHGGPLPSDWIPRHTELARKILARERELGMTPVLQGFTGHVPEAIVKQYPGTLPQKIEWTEFSTYMLDATDPLFQKLGTAWITEQTRLFGTDHLYAADPFIEMTPPSGDLKLLADTGRAIYDGMAKADQQAVWLLQGWAFMFQSKFWSQDRVKAFLDAVPNEKMLVLDLYCENNPVWSVTQGFYGKPWVWNFIYNFGDKTALGGSGPLTRFNDLAAARKNPLGQNLSGVGMMMEGLGHNPLVYDIMFELAWRKEIDLTNWIKSYAYGRYGQPDEHARDAWEMLLDLYNMPQIETSAITAFPNTSLPVISLTAQTTKLLEVWRLLLLAEDSCGGSETYRHDLVNIARQTLSNLSYSLYNRAMDAYKAGDAVVFRQATAEFLGMIQDVDELLATRQEWLFGSWVRDAVRWGATDAEQANLEWNARRILTLWGNTAYLRDYARKEWSGLLSGFYTKRWEIFFNHQQTALDNGTPFDQDACHAEILRFENGWSNQREAYPTNAQGNPITVATRLYEKARNIYARDSAFN